MGNARIDWSAEEKKVLKKFYPLLGTKVTKDDIRKLFLNRSWMSIQQQASKMSLKRAGGGVNVEFMRQLDKAVRNI